jgi:hypothetical protein
MFSAWAWGTYLFFAVFLAGGIVWVWFCLPETKGATLEEMDRVFKSHSGEEDAKMLADARREVGLSLEIQDSAVAIAAKEKNLGDSEESRVESA